MSDPGLDPTDEQLGQRLRTELPRYTAPVSLRVAIVEAMSPAPRPRRLAWLAPSLAAVGTALALGLVFVPMLPRLAPADPVQRLARMVVSEHTRVLMWGARRPDVIPAALPWLTQESGISLRRVFAGDDQLSFQAAEPVYLDQRRGLALHYRAENGHLLTYVALPVPSLALPEHRRVQIDRFRPALVRENGFSVLVWRHEDLVCFLVSDLVSEGSLQEFKEYFVRIRTGTEPFLPY